MQPQAAGLAWFAQDDYSAWRELLPDRRWHATWQAWLEAAEQTFQRVEHQGILAVKAHVSPDELVAWCQARGIDVDAHALGLYANEVAARALLELQRH